MPVGSAFAPYRVKPGAPPAETQRLAAEAAAEPLVAGPGEPLPAEMADRALAALAAWRAETEEEACRAADGSVSGAPGPARACLCSATHRRRIAEATASAIGAGFGGVCLDRPDAPLALGLLGAGFCPDCQRDFARELSLEYGEQFQPLDYLKLAREALAQAPGAVGFEHLPFGRGFWRFRSDALVRAVGAYARSARDVARAIGRPFATAAQFEALGPAQILAARHLDAAIYPAELAPHATGCGLFRLLRAATGKRPCAVAAPPGASEAVLLALARMAAACGLEIAGVEREGEVARSLASLRKFARLLSARRGAAAAATPVFECAILYSAESDLWTGGAHRLAVQQAGEALASLQIQAPVVLREKDAPPSAILVLAGARALSPFEAQSVRQRIEGGGSVLAFGEIGNVDTEGRPSPGALPPGRPAGVKIGKGALATLPSLVPPLGSGLAPSPPNLEPISRALQTLLGKGRRAASAASRSRLHVALIRNHESLEAHLVSLSPEPLSGATIFLGLHVAGGMRRARFQSADGADERVPMNPSGYSISTVLPTFRGYAVLSLGG